MFSPTRAVAHATNFVQRRKRRYDEAINRQLALMRLGHESLRATPYTSLKATPIQNPSLLAPRNIRIATQHKLVFDLVLYSIHRNLDTSKINRQMLYGHITSIFAMDNIQPSSKRGSPRAASPTMGGGVRHRKTTAYPQRCTKSASLAGILYTHIDASTDNVSMREISHQCVVLSSTYVKTEATLIDTY